MDPGVDGGGDDGGDPAPTTEGGTSPSSIPTTSEATDDGPSTASLGPAAVPAAGTYAYDVTVTTSEGEARDERETRVVRVLSGDRRAGQVEISSQLGDQSQVARIDWAPDGATVASTRIDSALGSSDDCAWQPPLLEYPALADGVAWDVEGRCETVIEGVPTTLAVTGRSQVVGREVVDVAGVATAVWRIERQRTTTISAVIGGQDFRQVAAESGVVWLDPALGLPVAADTTVTLDGQRTGSTRRVSRLTA